MSEFLGRRTNGGGDKKSLKEKGKKMNRKRNMGSAGGGDSMYALGIGTIAGGAVALGMNKLFDAVAERMPSMSILTGPSAGWVKGGLTVLVAYMLRKKIPPQYRRMFQFATVGAATTFVAAPMAQMVLPAAAGAPALPSAETSEATGGYTNRPGIHGSLADWSRPATRTNGGIVPAGAISSSAVV